MKTRLYKTPSPILHCISQQRRKQRRPRSLSYTEYQIHIIEIMYRAYVKRLNFQSLEVLSRYCDTQLQVTENVCDLWNFKSQHVCQCFKIKLFYFSNWLSEVIHVIHLLIIHTKSAVVEICALRVNYPNNGLHKVMLHTLHVLMGSQGSICFENIV